MNATKTEIKFYVRRDIFGRFLEEQSHYPTTTLGWFSVCEWTGKETPLI